MTIFHNKIFRGFLKLSKSSSIPSLHFLLGELPVEAHIHIATLNLFHNVWSNPDTTVPDLFCGCAVATLQPEATTCRFFVHSIFSRVHST